MKGEPDLASKRRMLGNLLAGERRVIDWVDRTNEVPSGVCACGIDHDAEQHCPECHEPDHVLAACPISARVARITFPAAGGLPAAATRTDRMPLPLQGTAVADGAGVRLRVTPRSGWPQFVTVSAAAALRGDLFDAEWEEPVPP